MKENPLCKIQEFGQSVWLDFIRRSMLDSGELERLIEEDGLRGVTVNPTILEHAIRQTDDYDQAIEALVVKGKTPAGIYELLAVEDVQRAADLFRPLYERTEGRHGYVSLEVSPRLAYDTEGTIDEARRFWRELDRPNVLIKVPSTREGLPAIQQLIGEGINVNVTLLFGLPRYREVADAYIGGLEARLARGEPVNRVASVASFFLSRIDVLVDPMLEELMEGEGPKAEQAAALHGQVAVASAKVAYQIYQEIFESTRFRKLADHGARVQRLLWASTSTKNPAYSDVKYVELLIGRDTVNTIPTETLEAFRDHGEAAPTLKEDVDYARQVLESLPVVGMDLDKVTQQLEDEGVAKFTKSYDSLMQALSERHPAGVH
jgi:transaldolase